jgi:CRISPR-associated endonuclease/helicase Cas3
VSEIQSHPHLTLAEHLAEIRAAAQGIWAKHSRQLFECCPEVLGWFEASVSLHDAGKGSHQFQQYIPNPTAYRGPKDEKAHTPLSTVFALAYGELVGWSWQQTLAVTQVAAGHHSLFRDRDELDCVLARFGDVIGRQLRGLDHAAVCRATKLALPDLCGRDGVDVTAKVCDQLEALMTNLDAVAMLDAVRFRLLTQLVFSILLEADKAFLAIPAVNRAEYLAPRSAALAPSLIDVYLAGKPTAAINDLRRDARTAMLRGMTAATSPVQTMTLPTGTGKTLLAATWALTHRERMIREKNPPPSVFIVLPFLAVIDQTAKEYEEAFKEAVLPGEVISYHSLSDRTFARDLEDESQDFFLDTWQSDVVLTTFDQFLFALLSPKARHQMRFHHLADSVVILDEVQALPCVLWEPLRHVLDQLTRLGTTRVLAMSATQPGFIDPENELIDHPDQLFARVDRYRLELRYQTPIPLGSWIVNCASRLSREWRGRRVLLTLNTRRSARRVRQELCTAACEVGMPSEFLTADVTPADRLAAIDRIKGRVARDEGCLVVSTQCIEAGVDIDMDHVIRDFGPLDSLVQIAGRCNRNGARECGVVEIVRLLDDETDAGRELAGYVYDPILLDATHRVLSGLENVPERDIYPLTRQYFHCLAESKDTGAGVLKSWAYWQPMPESVRGLLRGADRPKDTFIVVEQDPDLSNELNRVRAILDRWVRRREMRKLAGRIARQSVSVYRRNDRDPASHADPFPPGATGDDVWFWLLCPGRYTPETGLDLSDSHSADGWGVIL